MEIDQPKSSSAIPEKAKRVFKGAIFDTYQWDQELYDGRTVIFEKLKRSDTAMVIPVLPDGKILIADQEQPDKKPFIGLLGGRVDEGEEALEAAKRELLEESGYIAKEWLLFMSVRPVAKIDWTIYTFIARNCEKITDQKLDGGEKISLRIISFEEFETIILEGRLSDPQLKIKFLEGKLDPQKMSGLKQLILGGV